MITEYGSIKTSAKLDEKMQKELSRGLNIYCLISIIIGSIGTAAFLVLYIIAEFVFPKVGDWIFMLLLLAFAAFLGGGIGLKILLNKNLKTVRGSDKQVEYEFFKTYFTVNEKLNGETIASVKVYNAQILRKKETQNYLFLYISSSAVYPVDKTQLNPAELETLKANFGAAAGNTIANDIFTGGVPENKNEPADPFDEFN